MLQVAVGVLGDTANALSTYLLAVTNTFVAGVLVESLERSTDRLDRAEEEATAAWMVALEHEEHERAVAAAVRVLHDDVLNALHGIEGEAPLPAARVRRDARSAVEAVSALAGGDPVTGRRFVDLDDPVAVLVGLLAEASPVAVRLERSGADERPRLDDDQWSATARAIAEALRNVHRHSGTDRAVVRVEVGADRTTFEVVDAGGGFAPGAAEGVGLRDSVRAPVRGAGGTVEIGSAPGRTVVRLTFGTAPAEPDERRGRLARAYDQTLAAAEPELARTMMVPLALVWLPIGGWFALQDPRPLAELLLLAACCCLPVAVVRRLRAGPPTTRWLVGFAGAVSTLQVLALLVMPDGGLLDLRSWAIGFLATPLTVVVFVLPVRWTAGLVSLGVTVVTVAWLLDPALSGGPLPVPTYNALIAMPTLTALLGVALRRNALAVEREQDRFVAATAAVVRRTSRASAHAVHLGHALGVVVPWLHQVARGDLPLESVEVRRHARRLALEARDELHAPGFHSPALRRQVSDYRDRGGRVDISPGFPPGAWSRRSGRLLGELLAVLPVGHRLALGTASRPSDVRLVITPAPSLELLAGVELAAGVRRSGDAFAMVLEFEDTDG